MIPIASTSAPDDDPTLRLRSARPFSSRRFAVALALAAVLVGCGDADSGVDDGASSPPPAPTVGVLRPVERTVAEWEEVTGRLAAVDTVEVRARVSGFVEEVLFAEGSEVAEGQVLVTLDPRTFRADLQSLLARRDAAEVALDLARSEAERIEPLVERRAVSAEEADQRRRRVDTAEAALAEAEADLASARLDLEFAEVRAPIAGRIGRARVERGNLVTGGTGASTVLTTIVTVDPIELYFTPDEGVARRLLELQRGGETVPVEMQVGEETGFPRNGTLDFLDNRIDEETGSLLARAVFANGEGDLVPGMFARARFRIAEPRMSLLVPEVALGLDQTQRILLVVGDDDTVERRVVETGPLQGDQRVVRSGLSASDRVIVEGLQSARPGARVVPELLAAHAGAAAPSGSTP